MKDRYKQLNLEERERLYAMKEQGISLRQIAKKLGRNHTTLSRELRRNAKYGTTYIPCKAEHTAQARGAKQRKKAPLKNTQTLMYVWDKLKLGWSPEAIAGRLPIDHPEERIDDDTIYEYIYKQKNKKRKLWQHLKLGRKKRMKKEGRKVRRGSKIPGAISIDRRPKSIDTRKHAGHWESDNMEGKKTDKTAISVTTERLTRLVLLNKVDGKRAQSKADVITNRITQFPKRFRKTATMDNGPENTYHKQVKQRTGMNIYFCHPYHSWEKGTVENTVGRVRIFIPKGTSVDEVTEEQLKNIETSMNNTPRKCLGYLTPLEKKLQVLKQK